jgi:hypothetical protein
MLVGMLATLYKARGPALKSEVCAICVERSRGKTVKVDLGRGVQVWLCQGHASDEFRRQRSGRDFVLTLHRLWSAHGCLTKPRSKALDDHLAAMHSEPPPPRHRPGSYAWANLRAEAERRFFQGEDPNRVIDELRARHGADYARVPTVRTMRRWYHERRWLRKSLVAEVSEPGMPIDRQDAGQLHDSSPAPAATPPPNARPEPPPRHQEASHAPPTTPSASQSRHDRARRSPPRPPPKG